MSRKRLWAEVDDLVAKGKPLKVSVARVAEVVNPKRPRGRPRTCDPTKLQGYNYPLHMPGGRRMRCRARGCKRELGKRNAIVCSPLCERKLREEAEAVLAVLNGKITPAEFPIYHRRKRAA